MPPRHTETVVKEWRPAECNTRLGDIVRDNNGNLFLKIKCRRCSKLDGRDRFHILDIGHYDNITELVFKH